MLGLSFHNINRQILLLTGRVEKTRTNVQGIGSVLMTMLLYRMCYRPLYSYCLLLIVINLLIVEVIRSLTSKQIPTEKKKQKVPRNQ